MRSFIIFSVIACLVLSGCKSSKQAKTDKTNSSKVKIKTKDIHAIESSGASTNSTNTKSDTNSPLNNIATDIVNYAKQFEGVKYKFGGTTKKGMDCSGLVYESYKAFNIALPRISRDMANQGEKVLLDDVQIGDLLFFETNKKRHIISHVGLVVTALPGNIEFIHATTSQGVIISSLAERYWYFSFVEARRMF